MRLLINHSPARSGVADLDDFDSASWRVEIEFSSTDVVDDCAGAPDLPALDRMVEVFSVRVTVVRSRPGIFIVEQEVANNRVATIIYDFIIISGDFNKSTNFVDGLKMIPYEYSDTAFFDLF